MPIRCLLWDFGDTLVDELSLWRVSDEWMDVYRSFDSGLGAAWSLGAYSTRGFAQELARTMTLDADAIVAHLTRTDLFEVFPFTYSFFEARHLPQAIVTVNPTLFSESIVPGLGLDRVTDAIVVSAEERTVDKGLLCSLALERMGIYCEPGEALLIDNSPANLDAWASKGGAGYLYRGDDDFASDVAGGIDGLPLARRR